MKPVDPGAAAAPVANSAVKTEPVDELRAALEQRLWQLLLVVPDVRLELMPEQITHVSGVRGASALSGADRSTEGQPRAREGRDKDASSLLTSAAHMLALTIPQLGLLRYSDNGNEHRPQPTAAGAQPNWTVQLGRVDADGGSAAVNVQHPLLGDIALDVELSQGSVRVIATVPTDYGARILLEGQQVLAERLLRQGVTLEVLDVLVRRKRKGKDSQPARKRPRKEDR